MKRTFAFTTAAALCGLLALSAGAFAAKPANPGSGNGGGQGGGEDGGVTPDLGDLIVLYRDEYGRPIPTPETPATDPETGLEVPAGLCQQPIGLPSDDCPLVCSEGVPCLVPVDPYSCAVALGYEACTQEVDFGRTSVVRSPDSVLEHSLEEAVGKLATAQCSSLDAAGRLVTTSEIDGETVSAAIDSPLENLAIYWQLLRFGWLGAEDGQIALPDPDDVLTTAARGLGAAADKTGKVTVDQVVYLNQIMGLLDVETILPQKCVTVREEVQGNMVEVEKCVLDFSAYSYDRIANFGELPAPPYIPAGNDPKAGLFEYLGVVPGSANPVYFQIIQGPILDSVFCLDSLGFPFIPEDGVCPVGGSIDPGFVEGNVGGFTQAADDAREVIEFTHDRPIPLGYETPVPPCGVTEGTTLYDLQISPESGLQVPKNMVVNSPREITLAVLNAGPDTATFTVKLTGAINGVAQPALTWTVENITLAATKTWTNALNPWIFSLSSAATINWTATAFTDPECDNADGTKCELNPANNTVTATTTVKKARGGGR